MVAVGRLCLGASLLALCVAGCDRSPPTEPPTVEAASTARGGPTVKAPSSPTAIALSESQIDVAWQDNSTNETGFEVHRSTGGASATFALLASTAAGVVSYSNVGLTPSTQYCYKVRAFRTYDGKTTYSEFSTAACATTPALPAPAAPTGTDARPAFSTVVDVRWIDNSTNEDGFRVERSVDGGATWSSGGTVGPNVTSFRDWGLASEQQVCYRVMAFNAGGESPASNTDCTAPPAWPTGLTAMGLDEPVIDLAWTDNSAVEDGYEVQRSTDGVTFNAVAELPANTTSYRDVGVITNTTHSYQVRAKKDGGFSHFSSVASATAGVLTPPAAPYGLWAQGNANLPGTIQLSWTDASSNEDGFKIERCDEIECRVIATTAANASYYNDYPVVPGTTYGYLVRAYNRAGDSAPSGAQGMACDDWGCPEL